MEVFSKNNFCLGNDVAKKVQRCHINDILLFDGSVIKWCFWASSSKYKNIFRICVYTATILNCTLTVRLLYKVPKIINFDVTEPTQVVISVCKSYIPYPEMIQLFLIFLKPTGRPGSILRNRSGRNLINVYA